MTKRLRHAIVGAVLLLCVTLAYSALLKWLPERFTHTPQDALWAIPTTMGPLWWIICAAFSAFGTLTMFLYMIMNQPWSSLLLSRILIAGGMLCFALVPFNSGWMPWGVMLSSIGGAYVSFLIATDWCHRPNKWGDTKAALTFWRSKDTHRSIVG